MDQAIQADAFSVPAGDAGPANASNGVARAVLAVASCRYGGGIPRTEIETTHNRVQMHFAEKDASIPIAVIDPGRPGQPKVAIHIYVSTQHRRDERARFSAADYDVAQERTTDCFANNPG